MFETLASNDFMKRYVQESDPVMRADLGWKCVDMMALNCALRLAG